MRIVFQSKKNNVPLYMRQDCICPDCGEHLTLVVKSDNELLINPGFANIESDYYCVNCKKRYDILAIFSKKNYAALKFQ